MNAWLTIAVSPLMMLLALAMERLEDHLHRVAAILPTDRYVRYVQALSLLHPPVVQRRPEGGRH